MSATEDHTTDYDAVVVGAGFAGLRMLHDLRSRGLSVKVIEAGSDVGGTWYWNRYPGARTDTEAWAYCLTHDPKLMQEWNWSDRFPAQEEVEQYLQHVADRYGLREHIQFNTRMTGAHFDEDGAMWSVATDQDDQITCRFFITAVGILTRPFLPPFPGSERFRGQILQTSRWPKDPVDMKGKRVGIVGTGATGVQVIPVVAQDALHLTVFQRTPNFVLPSRNHSLDDTQRARIKREYPEIAEQFKSHFFGFPMTPSGLTKDDVSEEQFQRLLERGWETGGFGFVFSTFDDIITDDESNARAAEFVRNKIRAIVHDPELAEKLCPTTHPIASKRPPLGHHYYETFNRDNVSLVDVSGDAITEVTEKGLRLTSGDEHELDVLIFATGFDVATGSLDHLDIRGRGGETIADHWKDGPRTFLGTTVDGFPNMFTICGPQTPFANIPVVIEANVDWITGAIDHLDEHGGGTMEPTPEAVERWRQHIDTLMAYTVLGQGMEARSWFLGSNIPGKPKVCLFYFGGAGNYRTECDAEAASGFPGFTFAGTPTGAHA